jgi:hypothetical protein
MPAALSAARRCSGVGGINAFRITSFWDVLIGSEVILAVSTFPVGGNSENSILIEGLKAAS